MQKAEVEVIAKTDKAVKSINELNIALGKISTAGDKQRKGFKALDKATGGYATKVKDLAGAVKDGIAGLKGLSKTLKGVRTALLTTGVGALVIALGTIIAYWKDIKGLISGVSVEQQKTLEQQKEAVALSQARADAISDQENTLKLQGKTEREIRELKIKQTEETIKQLEAQLIQQEEIKKQQIASAERNKKITMGILAFISAPLLAILSVIDQLSVGLKALGVIEKETSLALGFLEGTAELLFDPEAIEEEGSKTVNETKKQLDKLKNTRDGFRLQNQKEDEQAEANRLKKIQEENDKKIKAEEDYQKRLVNLKNRIREAEANTEEEKRALELQKIREHNEQLMAEALANGLLSQELIDSLNATLQAKQDQFDKEDREKAQEKKIEQLELDKEFDNLTFEEQRNILNERANLLLQDETLTDEQRTNLANQFAEARVKIADAEFEQKQMALQTYAGALSDISGVIGEETQAGKMLAVASSLISTYSAIAGQLKAFSEVPVPGYAIAQAIATGAVGFANVKKILSTKVPTKSGGGGGGASVGGATPQAPSFNIVGATETSQLAEAIGEQTQEPVQAYVVANDVTTAQSLNNNIVEGATL